MNEQLKALLEKAGKRLDLVTTGVLVLLLVIAGYLYWKEANYQIPEPGIPQPRQWNVKIPMPGFEDRVDEQHAAAVRSIAEKFMGLQPEIAEDPEVSRLIRINMFDRKSAEKEKEVEAEINREYNRAEALFEEQNFEEAMRVVNSILEMNPNHRLTLDLKRRLEEATQPTGEATPEPGA